MPGDKTNEHASIYVQKDNIVDTRTPCTSKRIVV